MQAEVERAVEKSVGKLLFGLKDTLRHSLWKECLDALNEAANKDTLKS
jgi:ribosomal protein L18